MRSHARAVVRFSGACALALAVGCSLVVDPSDIDERCTPGRKLCNRQCVEISDPAYGCTDDRCAPCPLPPTAIPACSGDTCVVEACVFGFGCSGCGTNILTDEQNCGGCEVRCARGTLCHGGECLPDAQ